MNKIEDILVKAAHSNTAAVSYVEKNISDEILFNEILVIVESSIIGDSRLEGAYWITKFDKEIIIKYEDRLINLMNEELDSIVVHIMVALSKIKSKKALEIIIEKRIKPILYWEGVALENYLC